MATPDHPALALKRRSPVSTKKDALDPVWRQSILREMLSAPPSDVYRLAFRRWELLLGSQSGPTSIMPWRGECKGPLLVGVGGASVLEVGIALHHTYGVPWIAGSALKGLCAHYADKRLGAANPRWRGPKSIHDTAGPQGDLHRLVFGDTKTMGLLSFLDAWIDPTKPGGLVEDVLAPHHHDYYANKPKAWPADWDDPVPIQTIAATGTFLFAVESPDAPETITLRDKVRETIILPALDEWGIGAKTASGYGRVRTLD
jgi:CRISPR-associated protein Cmr6